MRWILVAFTHTVTLIIGFVLGIYFLPILTAPASLDKAMLSKSAQTAQYKAQFKRDLKGSDFFHWGEGKVSLSPQKIVHQGKLAPGPDYKLYLTNSFVEDEKQFLNVKAAAIQVGDVKTFDGFLLNVPQGVDIERYTTVVIWCESFGEFITSAKYR